MKLMIMLLMTASLIFAGGEISFKKQEEKLRRLEAAQLEAIKNVPSSAEKQKENIEEDDKDSMFEDDFLNPLKKKQNMKSS